MLSIITLNLRYQNPGDGRNAFLYRIETIFQCLSTEKPDLIGFQEMRDEMLTIMRNGMPEYTFIGHGREANLHGEHNCIAYRTDRFRLHSEGTFWLSPTPDQPGTKFEGQLSCLRICTWAKLESVPDGTNIAFYNTHLDHQNAEVRRLEVNLLLNHMIDNNPSLPVFLTGDFNMTPDEPLYKDILQFDRLTLIDVTREIPSTFHGFGKTEPKKIDYIFTDTHTAQRILSVRAIHKENNGIYLSDHDGIRADCEL